MKVEAPAVWALVRSGQEEKNLVVMCKSRQQAEAALERLRQLLADLGLAPKEAKTRIVHLWGGEEGFDLLGFHHKMVPALTARTAKPLCG